MPYTPGPWYARPGSQSIHVWTTSNPNDIKQAHHICGLNNDGYHRASEQVEANARLIAAAPDLLEALTAARAYINNEAAYDPTMSVINAAIEKAK